MRKVFGYLMITIFVLVIETIFYMMGGWEFVLGLFIACIMIALFTLCLILINSL
jgi:hypothetical protein